MEIVNKQAVSAFPRAMIAVFEESGFTGLRIDDLAARLPDATPVFEVSVSVGVAGQLKGYMFLQASLEVATSVAREISRLMGIELDRPNEFGQMHRAALAELSNQVSGRAMMYLSEMGIDADITPPTVLTGTQVSMAVADGLQFHDTALHGDAGDLNLVVGLLPG